MWDYDLFLCSASDTCKQLIRCYKRSNYIYQKNAPAYKKQHNASPRSLIPSVTVFSGNLKKSQELIQLERVIANQTLCDLVHTLKTGLQYLMCTQARGENRQSPVWTSGDHILLENAANPENPWDFLGYSLVALLSLKGRSAQELGKANCQSRFPSEGKVRLVGVGKGQASRRELQPSRHQVYTQNKMTYGKNNGRGRLRVSFSL